VTVNGGSMTIDGQVSDDGSMEGMTVEISGAASGTVTVNPDGTFSITMDCPAHSGTITITVTDADGNVTTQDIEFNG
jgi:hypothetical protein